MSVMHPEIETIDLTKYVEDVPLPCDWRPGWQHTPHGEAKWVVRRTSHGCERDGMANLICTTCKDFVMTSTEFIECGVCGTYTQANHFVSSIEPL